MKPKETFESFTSKANSKISIRFAEDRDVSRIVNFINQFFHNNEPLELFHPDRLEDSTDNDFYQEQVNKKLILLAVDESENLVGVMIGKVLTPNESKKYRNEASKHGENMDADILNFLAFISDKSDVLRKFKLNDCFQIFIVAVHSEFRGHGIATKLLEASLSLAKSRNFKLISVDCTNHFTAKICEKLQLILVSTVTYDEYNNHLGKQLFTPQPPHTTIKTFAKLL